MAGELRKSAEQPVERVVVTADLTGDSYRLTVEARGQSASVEDVARAALAEQVSRLIAAVSEAAQAGKLDTSHQSDSDLFGLGAPRGGRETLMHR